MDGITDEEKRDLCAAAAHGTRPLRLIVITMGSVFVSEALVMFLLYLLPPLPIHLEAVLDAFLLSILCFPILYVLLFRPMILQMEERERAARELRKGREELERRIDERTRELVAANESLEAEANERRRLYEEQKRLIEKTERVNSELRDLLHAASHDLKTPVRGISQLAQWIIEDYGDRLDEEGRRQLDLLLKRTRRIHDLIDGILQYSRAGRTTKGHVERVDTLKMVEEVVGAISPPAGIRFDIHGDLPAVRMDPTQLKLVLQHLTSNAVRFMDKTSGVVEIGCKERNGVREFYIRDNGPGIEERHTERIFHIFQTLNTHEEHKGSGIGLTIVKKIVEQNGGRVRVESKVGEGTTFYFSLPGTEPATSRAKDRTMALV